MSAYLTQLRGNAPVDIDVSSIRKEGWVFKESAVLRQFRRRWMVLTPDKLYSFKKERGYDTPPTEEVDLKLCGTVKSADDLTNRQYTFTVQVPDRNFFLMASSDAERNEWVAAIGAFELSPLERATLIKLSTWYQFTPAAHSLVLSTLTVAGRATTESRRVRSYSEEVPSRWTAST